MGCREDLGRLIAAQASSLEAGEVAELRRMVLRVERVWSSPDGVRLGDALVAQAAELEHAAAALHSFGRRIEAEAVAAAGAGCDPA
jgi:hypothetical protein